MVSLIQYGNGAAPIYAGLSTDSKPETADNGAAFLEMDTSKLYLFNAAENGGWVEWGA